MTSVSDLAQYILEKMGAVSTMKLQKLVYYCQAWSVVWDDDRIFPEEIQAWKNGPVVRELWKQTAGNFRVTNLLSGNSKNLTMKQRETVDRVLEFYGSKDAQWLSDLTHMEDPWKLAYEKGQNTEITLESMSEYYSSLRPNEEARS